jgi:formylglycine-generating enzyme required for sulfatase activity/cupin superfamily acireductone dioxygenase involved in methionine salvage
MSAPKQRSLLFREPPPINPISKGKNYLLLIGIDAYEHLEPLHNAVKDIQDFHEVLTERYHFRAAEAVVLLNEEARREHIIEAFESLKEHVREDDHVIIYFSGHGAMDNKTRRGYWMPVEANGHRRSQQIRNSTIKDYLDDLEARHVLTIVDSCFSGTLWRKAESWEKQYRKDRFGEPEWKAYHDRVYQKPSRWLLTSGREEVVSDGHRGKNSPFAERLLAFLRRNSEQYLPASDLAQFVKKKVPQAYSQAPYGGPILSHHLHQDGDFFFYLDAAPSGDTAWEAAQQQDNLAAYEAFLEEKGYSHPQAQAALARIAALEEDEVWQEATQPFVSRTKVHQYLARYPQGRYEKAARALLKLNKTTQKSSPPPQKVAARKPVFDFPVPEMVTVQGGTFWMGSEEGEGHNRERPTRQVTIADFEIGKYPVTQREWVAMMDKNPSHFKGDLLPVEQVSWHEIRQFIQKIQDKTGMAFRLPSEAEWEYAAGGGMEGRDHNGNRKHLYAGSNDLKSIGWFTDNSGRQTQIVGQLSPNELGLYDMSGNVWEWCQDKWHDTYLGAPTNGQAWESGSSRIRVLRGGSWGNRASDCRVAYRYYNFPYGRVNLYGIRLARTL